jgi:Tfp pilus assembly protein PilN
MRPINLIPQEERRSHGAVSRTGPIAYIFVGSLGLLLIGVVLLVLASNDISDRESKIGALEMRRDAVSARAEKLAPYASFHQVAQQRTETVYSLADSRFDWARAVRQLSLVLPPRVRLSELEASAGGGESKVPGPSMTLKGCAPGQEGVAVFAAALKDIDGVTRVGLDFSTRAFPKMKGSHKELKAPGAKKGFCGNLNLTSFEIIVAFDAAPPSPNSSGAEVVTPEAAPEAAPVEGEEGAPEAEAAAEPEAGGGESVSSTTTPEATG